MMRLFRRTPVTPENSARMLSLMAAHAEMGRDVPEVLR